MPPRNPSTVALLAVALLGLPLLVGCTSSAPTPSASSDGGVAASPSPKPALSTQLALATRLVTQEGLAIALASNVLQTQLLLVVETSNDEPALSCTALSGGGSHLVTAWDGSSDSRAVTDTIYYDDGCTVPYLVAQATVNVDGSNATASATVAYSGLDGTALGTLTTQANAGFTDSGINLEGTGAFARTGEAPASLGLACQSVSDTVLNCQGGVAQDFAALGKAVGSITPLQLTTADDWTLPITFQGSGSSTAVAPIGALAIVSPDAASLAIQGGSPQSSTIATAGQAGGFVLFPPTPTGWTVTDTSQDVSFTITVLDDTTRALSATVTQLSTHRVLASLTLDKSGTGTITYLSDAPAPVTSWMLTR